MRFAAWTVALCAAVAYGQEPSPRPAEDLLAALHARDYQTRRKAVLAVEGRTEPELFEKLLTLAREDSHPNIRGYAAEVLGTFRDERVFPLLVAMVENEKFPGPRQSGYVALGKLKDPRGYEVLIGGLEEKGSTAAYAARGLGLLGDPRAFAHLARFYRDRVDGPYAGDPVPEALLALDKARALAVLLPAFAKAGASGRASLVRHLSRTPSHAVREAMAGHLAAEDGALRISAVRILGQVGDEKSTVALLSHFERMPEDRWAVARALGELQAKPAAGVLARSIASDDARLRRSIGSAQE